MLAQARVIYRLSRCITLFIILHLENVYEWGSFMAKTLCKWKKKEIEQKTHEIIHIVDKPRYFCIECARAAHDKGFLCKAIKLH